MIFAINYSMIKYFVYFCNVVERFIVLGFLSDCLTVNQ